MLRLNFRSTNNEVKYEGMVVDLKLGKDIRITEIRIYNDSKFVVNQVTGEF